MASLATLICCGFQPQVSDCTSPKPGHKKFELIQHKQRSIDVQTKIFWSRSWFTWTLSYLNLPHKHSVSWPRLHILQNMLQCTAGFNISKQILTIAFTILLGNQSWLKLWSSPARFMLWGGSTNTKSTNSKLNSSWSNLCFYEAL